MCNSYTQKFSYNAGGTVKMVKLEVEYRNKGMRGGWTTRSILKNDPMEDDDWLDVLRNLYAGQEATVRTGHRKQTCSKSGKEYAKTVYCHPDYLTYMQSTSCEMPGWMKHKPESRLPGEISTTSVVQMTPPL